MSEMLLKIAARAAVVNKERANIEFLCKLATGKEDVDLSKTLNPEQKPEKKDTKTTSSGLWSSLFSPSSGTPAQTPTMPRNIAEYENAFKGIRQPDTIDTTPKMNTVEFTVGGNWDQFKPVTQKAAINVDNTIPQPLQDTSEDK